MHREDAVHLAHVDGDAAERRVDVAFERRAGAEGDDRHAVCGAEPHDLRTSSVDCGNTTASGGCVGDPGQGVGVLLAHRLRRGEAGAEALAEGGDDGFDRFLWRPAE